jgi:hypothetical protein
MYTTPSGLVFIVTPDIVTPPAVYPVPVTSLVVEYTVVSGPNVAKAVYNAIFKVSADKFCWP